MTKTVLITGSNGLLGQKLVKLLSTHPIYRIIACSRGQNRLQHNRLQHSEHNYHYVELDITKPEQIERIFNEYQPDVVIHCAAMTQADQCETHQDLCAEVNLEATKLLIQACQAHNSFFCFLSTDFIFDGKAGPYDESAQAKPINYYGQSKWLAEQAIQNSSIDWAIVRTVLVYGVSDEKSRSNFILWVKKSLEQGKPLKIVNDQWRTPTLVEDLAQGCALILQAQATGVYNLAGAELLTPYDMAHATADYFGLDTRLITSTSSDAFPQAAKRPVKTGLIINKAKQTLGYAPCSFKEGIAILDKQLRHVEC